MARSLKRHDDKKQGGGKQKRGSSEWDWKHKATKDREGKTKAFKGKTHHWCTNFGVYIRQLMLPQDRRCKTKTQGQDIQGKAMPLLMNCSRLPVSLNDSLARASCSVGHSSYYYISYCTTLLVSSSSQDSANISPCISWIGMPLCYY